MVKLVARGAEAELFLSSFLGRKALVKKRVEKKYRVKEIDVPLRRNRTRGEAWLIAKAKEAGVQAPLVYALSEFEITMSFIEGVSLRELLKKKRDLRALRETGASLARLHSAGIVHGDFTTANVIVGDGVWVIDFGLGCFSRAVEDRGVDVLLMKKALAEERLFREFAAGYDSYDGAKAALKKVGEIESRGRYVVDRMQK